ncbi:hypothetical protein BT67DRAFT_445200 [Trichocladium antarcticum]|uniref:Uncharacterized protein n=1 Tax=Trichocladium antarcticum TaxID=1450529 RepID=A0AAN6UD84_9PEZI|nr:hypothetical protein BT67DRAFT_445200 [Trichocladium antarcticum]
MFVRRFYPNSRGCQLASGGWTLDRVISVAGGFPGLDPKVTPTVDQACGLGSRAFAIPVCSFVVRRSHWWDGAE